MAAQVWWKTDSQRTRFIAREARFYGIVDEDCDYCDY